jgi:molecular chaperone GrpE
MGCWDMEAEREEVLKEEVLEKEETQIKKEEVQTKEGEETKNLEEELKLWKERALRYAAEVENLKKAFQREKEEYYKFALENVFRELLPSIDNLELALKSFETSQNISALKEGVALSLKVLIQTLEKFGLKQFEPAIGEPFQPYLHEALQTEHHPEIENGKITRVFQKGYMLHNRVIRPALVCVCMGRQQEETQEKITAEEENGTE